MPVLIQVPAVRPATRPARRPSALAAARLRSHGARRVVAGRRPRRRLRREVRMAFGLIGSFLPLTLAVALLHGAPVSRLNDPSGARAEASAVLRPPAVSISITVEPTAHGPHPAPEPPVDLPGYLLPVDASEDGFHAGG